MELKERIIQEASQLFFNKGVKSMTMSDIANAMGISKRTLYEVFRDKDDLLATCVDTHLKKADQEFDAIMHNSKNVIDSLMCIYSKHLSDIGSVNQSVIHDLKKYHAPIYAKIEASQKEGFYSFLPLFEKGVEQGLIRRDVNFEILLWLLKSQFRALMEDGFIPTDKYSANEVVRTIIINFIRGIVTPLGNEQIEQTIAHLKDGKV
jgi:AcrR family transcriptional regulator